MSLLEIDDLHVHFRLGHGHTLRAVNGVSLRAEPGESVGLVGESGCGKSSLSLAVLKLNPITAGAVRFAGQDVPTLGGPALRQFRRAAQMIFQDPYGSLNPRLSVGAALDEVLKVHRQGARDERRRRVAELLEAVGLDPDYGHRYPHEFSGGQRQRIGIARALALNPSFVIADEPVSALDVSVQAQILNLLKDLQQQRRLTYLFIAHDLAVVQYMCARVYVMYLGRILEAGPTDALFARPAHPYTEALLAAVPDVERGLAARRAGAHRAPLAGDVPRGADTIAGCPFHPRCRYAQPLCRTRLPEMHDVGHGQSALCHFAGHYQALAAAAPAALAPPPDPSHTKGLKSARNGT